MLSQSTAKNGKGQMETSHTDSNSNNNVMPVSQENHKLLNDKGQLKI